MQTFEVVFANEPARNRRFKVRGICKFDVLNPCWDSRPYDVPGLFWGDPELGAACEPCTAAAKAGLVCQ